MIAGKIALLLGLFAVPAYLLSLGNRFRYRTPSERGRFWGGVIGHSLGVLVAVTAMLAPPLLWPTSSMRDLAVHWSMVVLGVGGLVFGAIVLRRVD